MSYTSRMHGRPVISTDILLRAYAEGIFPMAERREDDDLYWVSPDARGVIPLDDFHISRRLARTVRSEHFHVTADMAFGDVIRACAAPGRGDRRQSWINAEIVRLYTELHAIGRAHSIECWRNGVLAGGLYGVRLGAAFFGESMFSRERDASKVALVHLVERLKQGGFTLLDAQFQTEHLAQFGAIEIPREEYLGLLQAALQRIAIF
ncbi:MAG: leucyl/phenylalanyl-tRNA--protein transferase [Rhizomicrobium sp.]